MKTDEKIRDYKLKYDINSEAKISALSSGKIDKWEYLTGGEIVPSDPSRILEQDNFIYHILGKAFEKQINTIEHQSKKKNSSFKSSKSRGKSIRSKIYWSPKGRRTNEIKCELCEIKKKREDLTGRNNLKYKTSKQLFDFQEI